MLPCCFKAGLHHVTLSARRTRPRLRGSCRASPWERSRDPGPERLPERSHPVWSLQEEGQGPCFLPPPGEAVVLLLSVGVTVTYILGGWETPLTHSCEGEQRVSVFVFRDTHFYKIEDVRIGTNQAARFQALCCESNIHEPPLPPVILLCSWGISDTHSLNFLCL